MFSASAANNIAQAGRGTIWVAATSVKTILDLRFANLKDISGNQESISFPFVLFLCHWSKSTPLPNTEGIFL